MTKAYCISCKRGNKNMEWIMLSEWLLNQSRHLKCPGKFTTSTHSVIFYKYHSSVTPLTACLFMMDSGWNIEGSCCIHNNRRELKLCFNHHACWAWPLPARQHFWMGVSNAASLLSEYKELKSQTMYLNLPHQLTLKWVSGWAHIDFHRATVI